MRNVVAVLMAGSLLSGCAGGLPGLRPLTYQEPGETRVYTSYKACPHTSGKNFAPVLTAVGVEAASQLIKGFGTALTKGAEGGALPASVSTTNIEVGADLPQCLVIVRGRFAASSDDPEAIALPSTGSAQPLRIVKRDGSKAPAALPAVLDLQHYIELQLLPSANRTAMTFGPALIHVARSMDGARSGDRTLSIAVKFDRPGKDEVGSAVLIGNRRIGDLTAYPRDPRDRMLYEAPWFAIIEGVAPAGKPGSGVSTAAQDELPTTPEGTTANPDAQTGAIAAAPEVTSSTKDAGAVNGPLPYTVTTTVIETRPTKEFLAFVASVFNSVEPTINSEVKGTIDPAARRTAAATSLDNESAFATSFAAAQTSLLAYCALPATTDRSDLISKSASALTAQLAANKAALSADRTQPFPTLVEVGSDDPSTVDGCAGYR